VGNRPETGVNSRTDGNGSASERPRFLIDAMCHPLVSWLRIFDYDTLGALELGDSPTDRELMDRARKDERVLVTRDKALSEFAAGDGIDVVFVDGNETVAHLRQLVASRGIDPTPKSSRCTVCNGPVGKVGAGEITDEIALRVAGEGREIWRCSRCGQYYWRGSQWTCIERIARDVSMNSGARHQKKV